MNDRRAAEMEVEALNYWLTMQKLNAAYYDPAFETDAGTIAECARDLGDMMQVSDWSRLKDRCAEAITPSYKFIGDVVA